MKKTAALFRRFVAAALALMLLVSITPVRALSGGTEVTVTPFQQFCGAYINLGGTNYLCAVDLGSPIIDSASDTVITAGTTVRLELFFSINDGWYACRKQEMQGDPNEIFTVRFNKTLGGDRVSDPVWKTYPDDGYGERYYLEFTVLGGDTEAPIDVSIALIQPDAGNVGADYRLTGTSAAYSTCAADFNLPGYSGPCDVYFGDPVTSTGDAAAMVPGATVCFPLMFMGGDGQLYAAYNTELQGDPNTLFELEQSSDALLTKVGWKTWDNGHWYLEYTVGQGDPGDTMTQQVRLRQSAAYKATPWKSFSGTMGQKGQCSAPISIGGTVYDCAVDLQGYLTSTGDEQNMTANSAICFPLMFLGSDGQWYPVLAGELQGDPAALFTIAETITSGNALLTRNGWKTWENGHYYVEYSVADSQYETELALSVQLKQDAAYCQGAVVTFSGKAPASTNPAWRQCVAPISIGGTVYDCIVDIQGYLTSSGSDTLSRGGSVCFPLMFQGGDGQWYPVLASELQGTPDSLFEVQETVASGGALLTKVGWGTWENGHYYLEYAVADAEFETAVDFSVKLLQTAAGKYGDAVQFVGSVPASDDPYWKTCRVPISIGGTVYECVVDLQGYHTSSGTDDLENGGTIAFPLVFQSGDGQWYPVLKDELQGDPNELLTVDTVIASGADQLQFAGWGSWESGHYYAEFKVASAKAKTDLQFTAQLKKDADHVGTPVAFDGTIAALPAEAVTPCSVPIMIGGTVYDCIVDLQGCLTSSGSNTLSGGGTVAFPLMFLGGDGVWYPVLKNELQGDPAQLLSAVCSASSGGGLLTQTGWGCWDNGHYYLEYKVANATVDTNVKFSVQLRQSGGKVGSWDSFTGFVPGVGEDAAEETAQCIVPIQIEGTVYDCVVDLQGSLTSSGSNTLDGSGTVAFPLMFLGGDGVWYPVLKDELQGDPGELLGHTLNAVSGGELLTCIGWGYWESGHYYLEYQVSAPEETTELEFGVTLTCGDVSGTEDVFIGYVQPGPDISSQQIPLKPSASLVVERIEECQDFNTMSFTIGGVRYNDGWPIDFESPNTTSAVITDGTIIRSDLCFKVNGQWYPVRQQECNESIEELFTYDYQVLSGEEFLSVPRFTTRYDAYGDIWQFEVAVNSEEEGEFSFTLQLVSRDGAKTGSKYKVTGRVQNGQMTTTVEEIPDEGGNGWLWAAGAGAIALAVLIVIVLLLRKKKEKS